MPRLYAAASLKPRQSARISSRHGTRRFPRLYAAASLKPQATRGGRTRRPPRFPRLYAAASLKPVTVRDTCDVQAGFPRLYAAASLKRISLLAPTHHRRGFPRLYAAASLKLRGRLGDVAARRRCGFPRLYAAASLKPQPRELVLRTHPVLFSAALCRGLIEATRRAPGAESARWFSAALCRGLIEALGARRRGVPAPRDVFRGSMPRPH